MRKYQSGFLHNLLVPTLLIFGVMLAALSQINNTNVKGQAIAASVDTTRMQLTQIRQALTLCRTIYPSGDNLTGFNPVYPKTTGGTWESVRVVKCPVDNTGTNEINLWLVAKGQMTNQGAFLLDWEYKNDAGGVKVRLRTEVAGDQYGNAVLSQVASRLHVDEKTLNADELIVKMF